MNAKRVHSIAIDGRGIQHRFWCPGCDTIHSIQVGNPFGNNWTWNGSEASPTYRPSVLCTWDRRASGDAPFNERPIEHHVCHSWVTDGRIQYLEDSTHQLAGQTVDLPLWDLDEFAPLP